MNSRIYLFIYIVSILIVSALKDFKPLVIIFFILLLLANKDSFKILKKAILLVAFFSLTVSLSYCTVLFWQDKPFLDYFLTVNLRSLDMIILTLLFGMRANIYDAFSFSKDLSFLMILSMSKILTLQRAYAEYTLAMESRTIKKPSRKEIYGFLGSAIASFLDKSLRDSKENYEAMKSRGFSV